MHSSMFYRNHVRPFSYFLPRISGPLFFYDFRYWNEIFNKKNRRERFGEEHFKKLASPYLFGQRFGVRGIIFSSLPDFLRN